MKPHKEKERNDSIERQPEHVTGAAESTNPARMGCGAAQDACAAIRRQ
jgi:hypothetical protein